MCDLSSQIYGYKNHHNVHTHETRLFMQQLLLVLGFNIDNKGCLTALMREILFVGHITPKNVVAQTPNDLLFWADAVRSGISL